jgi:hypothetical protein
VSAVKARHSEEFDQRFGSDLDEARSAYGASPNMAETFMERTGVSVEFDPWLKNLTTDRQVAVMSGLEHGIEFVGGPSSGLLAVRGRTLENGVYVQNMRRENGYTIDLSKSSMRQLKPNQIEQVMFHEVAHSAEYSLTSYREHEAEVDRLISFRSGRSTTLRESRLSGIIEEELCGAGYDVVYSGWYGSIYLGKTAMIDASKIPSYAAHNAEKGFQDSELAAESIRFVANNGAGKNAVADVVEVRLINGN